MTHVVPSQVVSTIDKLFPDAATGSRIHHTIGHAAKLLGIVKLAREVPQELLVLPPEQYAILIHQLSIVEYQLDCWVHRGGSEGDHLKHQDPVALIREALVKCPDEFPAPATMELSFISDQNLRQSISADVGAAYRAFHNLEWKAATVLAGAAIEALLHWKLGEPPRTPAELTKAATAAVTKKTLKQMPKSNRNDWRLQEFIEISKELALIKPETVTQANLARDYRNLIHPGASERRSQVCSRATALTALAGLQHVIDDLTP
jgi:hypothetical protein